jgi:hypothetical protein
MKALSAARAGAAAVTALLLVSGCLSVTEGAGKFLEGKFDYTARLYRSPELVPKGRGYQVREKAGKSGRELDILIEAVPVITLKASMPEEDGTFYLKSLEYLGGNSLGGVEFSLALSGGGTFIPRGAGNASLRLRPPTEPALISGGNILREGTRLSGEEALRALNNRYERIQVLTGWMRQRKVPLRVTGGIEEFDSYWKPILLPELVPEKKRPQSYNAGTGVSWVTAEQVRWNAAYTEQTLPEELRPLRDSGTLKRDWEESRDWIFLVYAWDHIFNTLETSVITLQKK